VVTTRALVAARGGRVGGKQLVVEVAPAQLPDDGVAAGLGLGALGDLEGREAAEVEIGREARRPLDREIVATLLVRSQPVT
jgi:hypothetical protein